MPYMIVVQQYLIFNVSCVMRTLLTNQYCIEVADILKTILLKLVLLWDYFIWLHLAIK